MLMKQFGPFPMTERGVPSSLYTHPKEPRVIYPSGRSVVVRGLDDPSDCFVYHGHNHPVTVAKFSPSGYWVASADETGRVRVWSWDNPEHMLKVEVPAFSGRILDLDWDPESKRIVVVGDGKQMSAKVFMWDTGNSVGEMVGHTKRISTVSYKPSRPFRIMTGSEDFKTCFFKGPPFKLDHSNADHTKEVWCVRYSPDGEKLVSVGADRRIVFYDAKEGTKISEVVEGSPGAHTASITGCCWSPDSATLATCSLDKTVKLWALVGNTAECSATVALGQALVGDMACGVAWSGVAGAPPPMQHLVVLDLAGDLHFLDHADPSARGSGIQRTLSGHCGAVTALAPVPGSSDFLTGGTDGDVVRWASGGGNAGVGTKVANGGVNPSTRSAHAGKVVGVARTLGAVVSVGFDDKALFADPETLQPTASVPLDSQPQGLTAGAASGLVLVTCGGGTLMGLKEGAVLFSAPLPAGTPSCVALSPDEAEVAVGIGAAIHTFALTLGSGTAVGSGAAVGGGGGGGGVLAPRGVLAGHRGALHALAYSPDGQWLAGGDANREVVVWDRQASSVQQAASPGGGAGGVKKVGGKWVFHTSGVTCLSWSADSLFVASGSFDQSVIVWSLAKVMKRTTLAFAHKGGVSGVAFLPPAAESSSGEGGSTATLVSTGNDGSVAVWDVAYPGI